MNWPWMPPSAKDVACIAAVIVSAGVLLFLLTIYPYFRGLQPNKGFGPEWNCAYPGQGDPVCIKMPPANSARMPGSP